MHPHLADVLACLTDSTQELRGAVDDLPPELRGRRPAPDKWSAIEVLEHVALVEARFAKVIREAIEAAHSAGLDREAGARAPLPEPLATRLRDRSRRRDAPETALPGGEMTEEQAWAALAHAQQDLRATVTQADGLALSGVIREHPAFGALNVYQWIELIAVHEARHAGQIREILTQVIAPS